jgi:hypothetical protein
LLQLSNKKMIILEAVVIIVFMDIDREKIELLISFVIYIEYKKKELEIEKLKDNR